MAGAQFSRRKSGLVMNRRAVLVGAGATLVGGALYAQEPAAGKVESIRGNAFAEGHDKTRRTLQPTAEVFVGDLVETETDSRLTMRLGEATLVKLGALAKLLIDKFVVNTGGTLSLEQGPLVIDRNDRAKNESLRVHSPFALIAVRGTMFFAGPSNNVFGVFVGRGLVEVTGGDRTVIIRPGLGTNIANPGDAPTEPGRWSPGRIMAALRSVN
jgi:hypothetical protein